MKNALLAIPALACVSAAAQNPKPNVVVIMVDDMGYSDIGCYGSEIPTPNIDLLAAQGARMTQFYSNPRSCPTRASLLTGMYPTRAGVGQMDANHGVPEYQGFLRRDCATFAEAMKHNGYATFMSGKWHVGSRPGQWPADRGFDRSWAFLGGATDFFQPRNMVRDHESVNIDGNDFYMTDAISDHAVEFLRERDEKEPFFLYVAYTAPHWPLQAPRERIDRFRELYMTGWDELRGERHRRMLESGILPAGTPLSERFEGVPSWKSLPEGQRGEWAEKMAIYAAMISIVDDGVGRILGVLDEQGTAQNTIVMFLSDNGACPFPVNIQKDAPGSVPGGRGSATSYDYPWANLGSTPLRFFKRWTYEGGINVPFIVRYPGVVRAGEIYHTPAHVMDIMPTCVDYAGGDCPARLGGVELNAPDGLSMRSVLAGGSEQLHSSLCWEHYGNRAIRSGDWKLVFNSDPEARRWELYNLRTDRTESRDIIADNRALADSLEARYRQWMEEYRVIPAEKLRDLKK